MKRSRCVHKFLNKQRIMRTFWGRKGKPITLPCSLPVSEDSNYSLEWRKDSKLIMSAYGDEAGHAAPSLQGQRLNCSATLCCLYSNNTYSQRRIHVARRQQKAMIARISFDFD
ncbi:unnamed protein product [Heligmosomoides polygyrus]|uniref:Ig-like domain-containing protein n=1 Tax=Heligmosomoides polygyrus TaxID=6339 RepID=A0A183F4F1_HELPZ|nr:unnamed protein product [Heligmosomoides polygyrus]